MLREWMEGAAEAYARTAEISAQPCRWPCPWRNRSCGCGCGRVLAWGRGLSGPSGPSGPSSLGGSSEQHPHSAPLSLGNLEMTVSCQSSALQGWSELEPNKTRLTSATLKTSERLPCRMLSLYSRALCLCHVRGSLESMLSCVRCL